MTGAGMAQQSSRSSSRDTNLTSISWSRGSLQGRLRTQLPWFLLGRILPILTLAIALCS